VKKKQALNAAKGDNFADYNKIWDEVYGDMQQEGPTHRHMRRILESFLDKINYNNVIDIGCGLGHNHDLLSKGKNNIEFSGIDISTRAIESVKTHHSGNFFHMDIQCDFPKEKKWDLVFSSMVLEHLSDDVSALKNMRKITGKYVLIATIAGNYERYHKWESLMGHVRNYKKGELEEKLINADFKNVQTVYWGFPFYTPCARILQSFSKVGTGNFNIFTKFLAEMLNGLYYLNSFKKGDVLFAFAEV